MNAKKSKALRKSARKSASNPFQAKKLYKYWKKLVRRVKKYQTAIRKV